MHNIDLSKHNILKNEKVMFYGKAIIMGGYRIVSADELFYQFVGHNDCYAITELIHPEDEKEFVNAVEALGEEEGRCVLRFKCYTDEYRYIYISIKKNGRRLQNTDCYDMFFYDIVGIKDKFIECKDNVNKYRQFMSLSNMMFFEYTKETDNLFIYKYVNSKNCPIFFNNLDEALEMDKAKCENNTSDGSGFLQFYEVLKNGADHFDISIYALDNNGKRTQDKYFVKGKVLKVPEKSDRTVGVITKINDTVSDNCYYLSENALDHGTGVLNKRAINEYAMEKISEKVQNGGSMYLAVLDVDDFKLINDKFGHMYGDEVLQKVADIIQSVISRRGFVGRFGGDEFMVVLNGISDEATLRTVLKTITKKIRWEYLNTAASVTTSWGISKFPCDGTTYEGLFHIADKCLYIAKDKGKNRYIIYDKEKHGSVDHISATKRNTGIKAIESDEKKAGIVSELINDLCQNGKSHLKEAMKIMREYFDIDGIAIYNGSDMSRILSEGVYTNPIQQLSCIKDSAYLKLFNDKGIYMESKIGKLSNNYKDAYEMYCKQETGKFIQFIAYENEAPRAVISFDFFNRSPKFGTSDMGLITIAGRLMAKLAIEL